MDPRTHQDLSDASKTSLAEPVFANPGDVVIFTEGTSPKRLTLAGSEFLARLPRASCRSRLGRR